MVTYIRRAPETTDLYKIISQHWPIFSNRHQNYPKFVYNTFEAYLRCGLLKYGFLRLKCSLCKYEMVLALSCKKRGFCVSCNARAMLESTSHLVDNILPEARYRQIVVTLPFQIRYYVATNAKLLAKIESIMTRAIYRILKSKARSLGIKNPQVGSITFIQRFGSTLNLNPHFHVLLMEKAFDKLDEKIVAKNLPPINETETKEILHEIVVYTAKILKKMGYYSESEELLEVQALDKIYEEHPELSQDLFESLFQPTKSNKEESASNKDAANFSDTSKKGKLCYQQKGFTIHANTKANPKDRKGLERLLDYMARPALSLKRLKIVDNQVIYELKNAWHNGKTEVIYTPEKFLKRLVALIPPPKSHQIRHHGIFARAHPLRSLVILNPNVIKNKLNFCKQEKSEKSDSAKALVKNSKWAKSLSRVFNIDVGACPSCKADMIIMSAILEKSEIERYLDHVGLWDTGPPNILEY